MKPTVKVGDTVWFYLEDRKKQIMYGKVIWAYRGSCIVKNSSFLGARKQSDVSKTKEEAARKWREYVA